MNEVLNSRLPIRDGSKSKIHIDHDPRLLLILLAFCEKNVVRYFTLVVSMIPVVGVLSGFIVPTLYIILLLMYFEKYGAHVSVKEASVVLFVSLAIALSCILYPDNARYIFDSNNFWNTIFPCLRYYIIGLILIPDKKTLDIIGKASCLAILVETLFVITYMMPRGLTQFDDMSRAYQVLPNVLFALNYAFDKKRAFPWIVSGIGIVYCLSMGTRGPIFVLLVYFYARLLQLDSLKKCSKSFFIIIVVGVTYFFFYSDLYRSMLLFLSEQLLRFGVSTRVVDLAIDGEITSHLSGRDDLFEDVINKIKERPLLGYGVYGEWPWLGWSAHNILLELCVHYGVILGSFLLLWLINLIIRTYVKTNNNISKKIILMWACFIFVRGIFGGTYLHFGVFFLIGFCIRELRRICAVPSKLDT